MLATLHCITMPHAARVEKSVASTGPAETHGAGVANEPSTCEVQDPLTCATADATPAPPRMPLCGGTGPGDYQEESLTAMWPPVLGNGSVCVEAAASTDITDAAS